MLREALALCLLASLLLCSSAGFAEDEAGTNAPDASDEPELLDPEELLGSEERENPFGRDGWYIQFGYAYGIDRKLEDQLNDKVGRAVIPPSSPFIDNPNTANPAPPQTAAPPLFISIGPAEVSNSSGFAFRAGRRVLANLAVEFQVEHMTNFQAEIVDWQTIDLSATTLTANLKLPILTGRFQPYALIGAGAMWIDKDGEWPQQGIEASRVSSNPSRFEDIVQADDAGIALRLGGGVDVYIDEHVFVSSEFAWVASQGEAVDDVKYMSFGLGVGYRF